MKLAILQTENEHLFSHIEFFNSYDNVIDYWNEFKFLFGQRTLLPIVETLFIENGLSSIGSLFNLCSDDWIMNIEVLEMINVSIDTLETITEVRDEVKNSLISENIDDTDTKTDDIVSYDEVQVKTDESVNAKKQVKGGEVSDTGKIEVTRTKRGFNPEQIKMLEQAFNQDRKWRFHIYTEIANRLCLQIY